MPHFLNLIEVQLCVISLKVHGKKHLFEIMGLMSRLNETFENTSPIERKQEQEKKNSFGKYLRLLFIMKYFIASFKILQGR